MTKTQGSGGEVLTRKAFCVDRTVRSYFARGFGRQIRGTSLCDGPPPRGHLANRARFAGLFARLLLLERPQAAFFAQRSRSSQPPMCSPLMNTCGTVPLPVTAPTMRLRFVLGSETSE